MDAFTGDQKNVAGFEAGIAAILDYSGALDNLTGGGGVGMSAFASSLLTVFVVKVIGKNMKPVGTNKIYYTPLTAGIYSGVMAMIFNGVLGSRIQNPKLLSATGTFLGTYLAEKDADS